MSAETTSAEPTSGDRLRAIAWTVLERLPELAPATMDEAIDAAERLFTMADEEEAHAEKEAEEE